MSILSKKIIDKKTSSKRFFLFLIVILIFSFFPFPTEKSLGQQNDQLPKKKSSNELEQRIKNISQEAENLGFSSQIKENVKSYLKRTMDYLKFKGVDEGSARRYINTHIQGKNFPGKKIIGNISGIIGWIFKQLSSFFFALERQLTK